MSLQTFATVADFRAALEVVRQQFRGAWHTFSGPDISHGRVFEVRPQGDGTVYGEFLQVYDTTDDYSNSKATEWGFEVTEAARIRVGDHLAVAEFEARGQREETEMRTQVTYYALIEEPAPKPVIENVAAWRYELS